MIDAEVDSCVIERKGKPSTPPKIVWKKFTHQPIDVKQCGCYLLWNEYTNDGTTRMVHLQTSKLSLHQWAESYTHWAFFQKGSKRDHYG